MKKVNVRKKFTVKPLHSVVQQRPRTYSYRIITKKPKQKQETNTHINMYAYVHINRIFIRK